MITTPTLSQLQRGLAIAQQIAALETEMAGIFNGSAPTSAAKATPALRDGRKGKRSAATIAKMKASQKARWAKVKGTKAPVVSKAPAKVPVVPKAPANAKAEAPMRKTRKPMSPATKAKMAAAMKKRWAAAKAGKAPAPNASKNK